MDGRKPGEGLVRDTEKDGRKYMRKRILLISDIHNCHAEWYGVSNEERMERFVAHLQQEYRRDPYEMILFLGDYSLDFWVWGEKGCYLREGRSRTREFVENYMSRLPSPWLMIPGNHEQYGVERWKEITGCDRQTCWYTEGWLFILLDTFGADLDPAQHSDGTFTPMDTEFIRRKMEEYPDCRVVLCAHHFDMEQETEAAKALLRDDRIVCLASGHVHLSDVIRLSEENGAKYLLRTGHYSYAALPDPRACMFGYRDMELTDTALISRYITPENIIVWNGQSVIHPANYQDEIRIPLKK